MFEFQRTLGHIKGFIRSIEFTGAGYRRLLQPVLPLKPSLDCPGLTGLCGLKRCMILAIGLFLMLSLVSWAAQPSVRERISLNADWRFRKGDPNGDSTGLIYDVRPEVRNRRDVVPADEMPTEAVKVDAAQAVLKPWILPTGNVFIKDPARRHIRSEGNPGGDCPYVQDNFDDRSWDRVDLPHDWAIKGPFHAGWGEGVGGGMGRLPSPGIGWYRKMLDIPASDAGKSIFLDVDGAMSYAMVWLNGRLVGGWPYGYASWRVDLTPYVRPGGRNQLAIRLDNPPESSRWYPGGGIYRNVWLTKTHPVSVGQWGMFVTTRDVSVASAVIDLEVTIDNASKIDAEIDVFTQIFVLGAEGSITGDAVADFEPLKTSVTSGQSTKVKSSVTVKKPRLWGPPPTQTPHRYTAVTTLRQEGKPVDRYETQFGIRSLRFDPNTGIHVNDERIFIKGVNQHHDLGALGAAFNVRAAERQLEVLREMGCNAIRMAHNPPAPELLELTDRMGFLVVNEIFDVWERKKAPLDFHLIFPDWHEQDTRAWVRRDRNHPSVMMWSFGNEVGEQYTGQEGAAVARRLHDIVKEEDPTRPTTAAMNYAKPDMPMPGVMDVISLNYQGEGIRNAPAYAGLRGINTPPLYPAFYEAFPDKVILSSENAAALSTRGTYLFPVFDGISAPVKDGSGGDPQQQYVSAYDLYTAEFGSSADKVFAAQARHPYVAGGFVWSGWDYLGEPTPYYLARSSYFGIIDLAGFKKDRFYLYQSHWRPDLPMAHILPHWTWPDRLGQVTPVHVFTSGDEAELFLNGRSLGRKAKGAGEYRLRWDDVVYEPGELKAVAYRKGQKWAEDVRRTAGDPVGIELTVDRELLRADGEDMAFVTVRITDRDGITIPRAEHLIRFKIDGPGWIAATDNGDPTSLISFASHERKAFNGFCLAVVRAFPGQPGTIELKAQSEGLKETAVILTGTTK
jgi:beta-galactosidase